jgi:hypothetical protein
VLSLAFSPDGTILASGSVDTSILLWNLGGAEPNRTREQSKQSAKELETVWADLRSTDASQAFRAMRVLIASPSRAVSLIREHLLPVPATDPQDIAKLIANLNTDRFDARQEATADLKRLGEAAEPALRRALTSNQSKEAVRRIEQLLERLPGWPPERLRESRTIEVLEHIGNADAQGVLNSLAKGFPQARLTQEAKASLDRLAEREGPRGDIQK